MPNLLIYGANGYTGDLIAREAVVHGLRPLLAGRNAHAIQSLAAELGLEARVFGLDERDGMDRGLQGVSVVLHCAGPFAHTAQAMADGCIRQRVHYLDVTGEIGVFERLAARDAEARQAGITLLPGVGFDVVPSDCLAAHLKRRLPSATRLALGFQGLGKPSRGTATTIVENLHRGGVVRRDGKLTPVPAAWKTRVIDFGAGPTHAITIPWGDVSTAFYSTGIPNVEVYLAAPWRMRVAARMSRYFGWVLSARLVQGYLKRRIRAGPPGPTAEERRDGMSLLWGEATDDAGHQAVARLRGPDGYTLTAHAAVAVASRILAAEATPGFQTPSRLFGPDFVLTLPGVKREDVI